MCGIDPLEIAADAGAAVTGNEELIPLINGGETAGKDLISGDSLGKSLGQGAEQGGIALAGQEAAGAVGIGDGNSAFNDALGITGDNPLGTGLPDIGGGISDAVNSAGNSISSGFDSAKDALGITPTSSSSITDVGSTAGGGASAAGGGAASPGISASAAPEAASNQISTQLGANATGALGGTTGFGDVAGDSSALNTASADFTKSLNSDLTNLGAQPLSPSVAGSAGGAAAGGASSLSKLAPLVPLGNLAYQAISGPGKLPSSATALEAGGAATAPLLATENSQLNEGNTGQLTPSQQANITQYTQNAQNQLIQQLASSGVTDFKNDSRYISGMQQIQQQALAQQQQYIQDAITAGVSAGGAAAVNISQVANEQIAQDQEFQQALSSAFNSFGSVLGSKPNITVNTGA
jgi:hypothetical protein